MKARSSPRYVAVLFAFLGALVCYSLDSVASDLYFIDAHSQVDQDVEEHRLQR